MKLCIVSGIFEPESGGPATYAPRLASELSARGYSVTVVTFSSATSYPSDASYPFTLVRVVRGNKLFNRVRFFFAVWPHVRRADCVYMLDWFAAGLPASLASRLLKKRYVVRVGGDYLWEQRYAESHEPPVTLSDFYEKGLHAQPAYRAYARVILSVLRHASHIVFNAEKMRQLYIQYYDVDPDRTSVIWNPVPRVETRGIVRTHPTKEFVFWGRFVAIKNIDALVRAFAQADLPPEYTLALIGDGPAKPHIEELVRDLKLTDRVHILPGMSQGDVLERVKNARAFVLPSWTDISPNQVYEALAIGLPSIVTYETFLPIADQLPVTIHPASVEHVAQALEAAADESQYAVFSEKFRSIRCDHSWSDAAQQHAAIFEETI